jgi:hypothetical protein
MVNIPPVNPFHDNFILFKPTLKLDSVRTVCVDVAFEL